MIDEHKRHHGFTHWDKPRQETWIVPALHEDFCCFTRASDRSLSPWNGTGRLHRHATEDRLSGRDPPEHAAVTVGFGGRKAAFTTRFALTPQPPLPGGEGAMIFSPLSPGERGLGGEGLLRGLGGEGLLRGLGGEGARMAQTHRCSRSRASRQPQTQHHTQTRVPPGARAVLCRDRPLTCRTPARPSPEEHPWRQARKLHRWNRGLCGPYQ